jgi:serine/threonine protein kinase
LNSLRPVQLIRFGAFELDLRSRELRKNGRSAGLPEQSIKVLQMLLERPGDLVLRDEIRLRLWPNDTVVEFDHSINTAIRKLRLALGDSADTPRYIETLARRGYRWIAAVDAEDLRAAPAGTAKPPPEPSPQLPDGQLTGKRISHYRVLEVLGGGGMGVVYKAEDLKLGRRVALKFLPEELAQDHVALQRLEREARAASALNHPNVCTIYEIAEYAGRPFIAMEFLDGETMREQISEQSSANRRPDLAKQIELGVQVCDALASAHASGIIHRDIKPANIFVTRNGAAKILDFGVAKLNQQGSPEANASDALGEPLAANAKDLLLTRTGVTMGTAGYMSPEQVRGEVLDGRTDLFSFGLVLYEIATGRAAFGAATAALMREAILQNEPPPVRELNPDVPAGLALIIHKALGKDRDARYQSAAEMRTDLESLRAKTRGRSVPFTVAAVGLGLLLTAAALIWLSSRQPGSGLGSAAQLRQLTTNTWENPVIASALSEDGRYLAYSDAKGMHIKQVGADDSRLVPQPEALRGQKIAWEINAPAWFPDSSGFVATAHPASEDQAIGSTWSSQTGSVWAFPVSGSTPHKLRDGARAWFVSADGSSISFGANKGRVGERELWVMRPDGTQARKVLEVDKERALCCLYSFQGGKRVAYVTTDGSGDTLVMRDLEGGPVAKLVGPTDIQDFVWLADGRLVYSNDCSYARFDAACSYWVERFDIQSGKLAEKARRLTQVSGVTVCCPSVTADARLLAFQQTHESAFSYVVDLEPGAAAINSTRHFALDEGDEAITDWTPDSDTTIIVRNRGNYSALYKQRSNAAVAEPIVPRIEGGLLMNAILSPDAHWVVFTLWPLPPPPGPTPPGPQFWRVPIEGGSPQYLFSLPPGSTFSCARAPSTLCVIGEPTMDRRQAIVSGFDPATGRRGRELLRLDTYVGPDENASLLAFALSPDGHWLSTSATPSGPVQFLSLRGEPRRVLALGDLNVQYRAAWTPDGRGLIVLNYSTAGAELLHLDAQGNARVLLKCDSPQGCFGVPSPDGRHLGVSGTRRTSNIWMLQNQ